MVVVLVGGWSWIDQAENWQIGEAGGAGDNLWIPMNKTTNA